MEKERLEKGNAQNLSIMRNEALELFGEGGFPLFDELEEFVFWGMGFKKGHDSGIAAKEGGFGEEVQVAFVFAGEEKKEGMDRFTVKGAVFKGLFREHNSHNIVVGAEEKIAGVGDGKAVIEGGGLELFPVDEELREDIGIEVQVLRQFVGGLADDFFFGFARDAMIHFPFVQGAIQTELTAATTRTWAFIINLKRGFNAVRERGGIFARFMEKHPLFDF